MTIASMLSGPQRRFLRRRGHELRPVLLVGAGGMSDAVLAEAEQALLAHELVKVRLRVGDREARDSAIAILQEATGAEVVQRIGHVVLIYRPHPKRPRIVLPSG